MKWSKKHWVWDIRMWTLLCLCMTSACGNDVPPSQLPVASMFEVSAFTALTNYRGEHQSEQVKVIFLDYHNAIQTGFVIPSQTQTANGAFDFSFAIKNNSDKPQKYFYKIYYRNDSYKYEERDSTTNNEHQYACENFYGSYEHTETTFKQTLEIAPGRTITVTDSLRIVGNPRNEVRYMEDGRNDRWKRNPRVGNYSFMLVVCNNSDVEKIPLHIKNIGVKNGNTFSNPFYYFLHNNLSSLHNTTVMVAPQVLNVMGKPDLGAGMYVSHDDFPGVDEQNFHCDNCGSDSNIYANATFKQFVHAVESSTALDNIPIVKDVVGDNYTLTEYNWNRSFISHSEMVHVNIESAKLPCKSVSSDSATHKIVIRNPATTYGQWRKERVGIVGRHGMTYGKYRFKCKLTRLLSDDGVWNGMTNAIWMIFPHGATEWNDRRICNKEGYMATYWGGYNDKKVPYSGYSEIDFEILKTVPYCPDCDFPPTYKNNVYNAKDINAWNVKLPDDLLAHRGDITVACTNWDMACPEPENYAAGCNKIVYNGQEFLSHRWEKNYRALTQKSYQSDKELFGGEYYYFEIDWQPTQIIWRIGPTPERMRIVGYMNDKVTMIANNQMVPIITQEWHNTKWWPGTPFEQGNIPFPSKDLIGEIFELLIY